MIRSAQELEGIQCSPQESANKQYIMNLKIALKETIDQNESLLQEVSLLRDQVQSLTNQKKERDDAIIQLSQALVNLQLKYGEQASSPRMEELLSRNHSDYEDNDNNNNSIQQEECTDDQKNLQSQSNKSQKKKTRYKKEQQEHQYILAEPQYNDDDDDDDGDDNDDNEYINI